MLLAAVFNCAYLPHLSAVIPKYSQRNFSATKMESDQEKKERIAVFLTCTGSREHLLTWVWIGLEQPVKMPIGVSCGKILLILK